MSKVTKKMINSLESCVDENLRGVLATYPALHLHPKHRVVTVKSDRPSPLVGLVGGGGSGHEPFAAALVGRRLLHAAVAGDVFAAPPPDDVLYAIAHASKYNTGGVLVIIGNYTGDRLNLGKAIEKAKMLGMNVEGLIVGEDVASSHNKTGGRSMVGEVFFYKLCGGMSSKGMDLGSIVVCARAANSRMATLGVCLSPCSLPGQPPLFSIEQDEMELGAGVHGEAGIARVKLMPAKETVAMMMDKIVSHLNLVSGDRVAVIVDNLGATSVLEMNILCHETNEYLKSKQIKLERLYSGHIKTSLEMHGFQICVLHLNQEYGDLWLECLDLPTDAPAWFATAANIGVPTCCDDDHLLDTRQEQCEDTHSANSLSGPRLSPEEQQLFRDSVLAAARAVIDNEELLNRLDSGCGDGDCGNTLRKFAEGVCGLVPPAPLSPARCIWNMSELAERGMGGTSGGLYSLGLSAAATALDKAKCNDRVAWLSALEAAIQSISKYGGAEPGDRTMLDTLHAAAVSLRQHLDSDLNTLLKIVEEAVDRGAGSTASMTARAGRASYVSASYLGGEDAGARAAALWITHILRAVRDRC